MSSVSYEEAETICELPPRRFWPRDFSPASALIVNPEPHLDSPLRVVLEVVPGKWLTCDAAKMMGESFAELGVG